MGLNIIFHKDNYVAIEDLDNAIDISHSKWDFVFNSILKESPAVYFKGFEPNYYDEDFIKDLNYVSEDILMDMGKRHHRILFRLKPSYIFLSRNLLSKIWNYYHSSSLIFLKDKTQEEKLVKLVNARSYVSEMIKTLDNVYIMFKEFDDNVVWLEWNDN